MNEDEVVQAVRAAREAFAASHGYNIQTMVSALRELALAAGGWEVVRLAPRHVVTTGPAAGPNPALQQTPAADALS